RALLLERGATLSLAGPGTLDISAGSLTLKEEAALVAPGNWILVTVSGAIELMHGARMSVSDTDAADTLIVLTAGGGVAVGGSLTAGAPGVNGGGGGIGGAAGGGGAVRGPAQGEE